jgi:AraC family transcriptional regulator, regulatory protein of adaptative response / methylated-DNA-[protein]-cysteine methyltransferase
LASLATDLRRDRPAAVNDSHTVSDDEAWAAFERRDRTWDGRIVGGVKTTGIYCRPSCPARRPKRENVEFFPDGAAAAAAGYRACAAGPTR